MALYIVVSVDKVYVDFGGGRIVGFSTGEVFDVNPELPSVSLLLRANPPPIVPFTPPPPALSPTTIVGQSGVGAVAGQDIVLIPGGSDSGPYGEFIVKSVDDDELFKVTTDGAELPNGETLSWPGVGVDDAPVVFGAGQLGRSVIRVIDGFISPMLTLGGQAQEFSGIIELVDGAAATVLTVLTEAERRYGGMIKYMVEALQTPEQQVLTGTVSFRALRQGDESLAVDTTDVPDPELASSGTLSATWSVLDDTDNFQVQVTPNTSLTPTILRIQVWVTLFGTDSTFASVP